MAAIVEKLYSFISSRPFGLDRGRAWQLKDALPLYLTGEEPTRKNGGHSLKGGNLTEIVPTTVTAFLEPVTDRPGIIHNREEEQWQNQHLLNPKRHIYFGMPPDEELHKAMVKERHDHPYTSCLPNDDDSESNEEDDSDSDDEDTLFES